jgi:RNA polymerase sigma-70 factor (ECF subfamily)
MRRYQDKTTAMGGAGDSFQTTRWSEIRRAKTNDETQRKVIVGNLLSRYWRPVYCYLRIKGYDNEAAKDMTQGFFQEIVLGRGLIQKADESKGRFRTFLLKVLERYVATVHRRETARKRLPAGQRLQLEELDLLNLPDTRYKATPEEVFHYEWVSDLLDRVLTEVRDGCRQTGKAVHWEVFQAKILSPIIDDTPMPSLTEICERYGIGTEEKASNMIITVKRRFRSVLERYLKQSVWSDSEAEEEFSELLKILCMDNAG